MFRAHGEVCVKVNAWVDEGVAELVRCLNCFPRLLSVASCEDIGGGLASVGFVYGETWLETTAFCLWLAAELHARFTDGSALVQVTCDGGLSAIGYVKASRADVARISAEIGAIASRWDADQEIRTRLLSPLLGDASVAANA